MEQQYKVMIVDDEPPARDIIEVFVARIPELNLVATCSNAMQALDGIQRLRPDLVFLDIRMPEMTGIDLMSLNIPARPDIILTTAYPEFALRSYEFSVIDYLVKPIAFERFLQAIVKFKDKQVKSLSRSWSTIDSLITDDLEMRGDQNAGNSVWLREEKRLLQIPYEEILYIEGLKDYVKVFLKDQMVITHMSIGKAEELFRPPAFIRIHRSYIVRQASIRLIDGSSVRLSNGTELLIGPSYREDLKKYISALR